MILLIIILILAILIGVLIYLFSNDSDFSQCEMGEISKIKETEEEKKAKVELDKFKSQKEDYNKKYGLCTKDIFICGSNSEWIDVKNHLFIYEQSSSLILNGKAYSFSEILKYEVYDERTSTLQNTASTSITKTSMGNMVGRAVVGGVVFGPLGALAGATTAKKQTEINPSQQIIKEKHNYTLFVYVDNISSPIEKLYYEDSVNKLQETLAILDIIIQRNSK